MNKRLSISDTVYHHLGPERKPLIVASRYWWMDRLKVACETQGRLTQRVTDFEEEFRRFEDTAMSHNVEHGNVIFTCDGTMEGPVIITKKGTGQSFTVPADALLAFVAEWRRNRLLKMVDEMTDEELLDFPFGEGPPS